MKFALVDNNRIEATKGFKGICPSCGSELIAKCGTIKINHWAHKGTCNCDPWWESETEWHRTWKNNFSVEWQECILTDDRTGEKHIADIRTIHADIIEFQHSHIDPIEQTKRERFYKKMIWVVDCTRLKRDCSRFLKGRENFRSTVKPNIFSTTFPHESFPSNWLSCSVPVIFDFKGTDEDIEPNDWRNFLYILAPNLNTRESFVGISTRESFIKSMISGDFLNSKPQPERQLNKTQLPNTPGIQQRNSQYVYDRGRFVKRRRL